MLSGVAGVGGVPKNCQCYPWLGTMLIFLPAFPPWNLSQLPFEGCYFLSTSFCGWGSKL